MMTEVKRTIVVGDVHGCLDELKALLDKVKYTPGSDRFIVAGDLVDRGPDSAGVVKFVRAHGECVLGNHEGKLLRRWRHIRKAQRDPRYKIPMRPDADQESTITQLSEQDLNWLSALPTYLRLPEHNIVIVHAGMVPGRAPEHQQSEILTMARFLCKENTNKMLPLAMPGFRQPANSQYWAELYDGSEDVIFGHNVVGLDKPQTWAGNASRGSCYGIDTGCVFGGKLTAVLLPSDTTISPEALVYVQVPAQKAYAPYNRWE